jgi:23S rRNA-/tRNA-specific pseudouridylate synthase
MGDHITHIAIRDETPVLSLPIEILFEDDLFIVVNKPSSMTVHPCGNFKFNSLMKILEIEHGKSDLWCVHWLDRQTSGIVFLAKNVFAANEFDKELRKDKLKKVYLAWVIGDMRKLPEIELDCKKKIYTITPFLFTTDLMKAT